MSKNEENQALIEERDQLQEEVAKLKAYIEGLEPTFKDLLFAAGNVIEVVDPLAEALTGGKSVPGMITKATTFLMKLPDGRLDEMMENINAHVKPICNQFIPYYQKKENDGSTTE